ncbi:phage late control D family protein [Streptomyces virginiae]|uniref:phage late control D family protein n=1 Tax=Streptomyces virginiae TaxID=1961 RepID=UPI0036B76934
MVTGTVPRPRVSSARPAVAVGGRPSAALAEGLLKLRVHESTEGLYRCEATFGNWGAKNNRPSFLYFGRDILDFGKQLTIGLGTDELFRGRITALEAGFPQGGGGSITVLAEDRHQDLRMTRRTRTFTDVSDAEVFTRVAAEHGLTADIRIVGPAHRVLAQLNQSDLAFLRERARAVDAELWMNDTTLAARTRSERKAPPLRLGYGNELRELTVLADLAGQRSSVTVSGWDVAAKRALAETADAGVLGGELARGTGGSQVLAAAFAVRKESVVHAVPLTGQEARGRAETLYRRIARRFLTARGVAETSAGLHSGVTITLDELGTLFSGEYYVTEVTHLFDDGHGLRSEFRAERAWLGAAS